MKICIIGAGAIGGMLGTRLALHGKTQVSALARGDTLQALRSHGWRMSTAQGLLQCAATASDSAAELGVQDLVMITVKGQALAALAPQLAPLLGPNTLVMPAMNGVPWWFCQHLPAFADAPLQSLDPDNTIGQAIALERVVGCVVHASAATSEPGWVQHRMGQGLIVGLATGGQDPRVQAIAEVLAQAGFDVTHSGHIRQDIWYKLWGNLTMNPISAMTGATGDLILGDPLVRRFCADAMLEASAIGSLLGCPIDQSPEDRQQITAKLGAFKTSMLQDAEAGRSLELDAIVTSVQEIGTRLAVLTPNINALLGLTRLFARVHGLYPKAS